VAPVHEYEPAAQNAHVACVCAPLAVLKVPAVQAVQLLLHAATSCPEYVPAGHCAHPSAHAPAPSRKPKAPAPQGKQSALCVDPTTPAEYVPRAQATHVRLAVAPSAVLYVPAAHGVQLALLPAPEPVPYVPAMHFLHLDSALMPGTSEYVPVGQFQQRGPVKPKPVE
jgi:hypothetical protein